ARARSVIGLRRRLERQLEGELARSRARRRATPACRGARRASGPVALLRTRLASQLAKLPRLVGKWAVPRLQTCGEQAGVDAIATRSNAGGVRRRIGLQAVFDAPFARFDAGEARGAAGRGGGRGS